MEEGPSRKLAVLLHADVVDSTALVQLHETRAHQRIQDTFRRFSETIISHGGTPHEIRGDALVAEFSKASDAVGASLAFQEANAAHNDELPDEVCPVVRVGIAMGEVVVADNTVTGEAVVLAQRLEQLAKPGGVCIQATAQDTSEDASRRDRRRRHLRPRHRPHTPTDGDVGDSSILRDRNATIGPSEDSTTAGTVGG